MKTKTKMAMCIAGALLAGTSYAAAGPVQIPANARPAAIETNIEINQEGLSGTWYNPSTSGQGLQFVVGTDSSVICPDLVTPCASLFGAWYTYDTTAGDTNTQRWYSIQATVLDGDLSSDVTIYQNVGGNFASPPTTPSVAVGTGTLSFDTCVTGTFAYAFDGGASGTIPLQRLLPNVECVETGTPTNPQSDFGLGGSFYSAATSGQGFLIEVNPSDSQVFVGWYTYADGGDALGASGQRWLSAQAPYTVGDTSIDLTVYSSTNGTFDSSATTVATDPVGTATLTFTSCDAATLEYSITAGELSGHAGSIELARLGATPASCSFGTITSASQ